MAPPQPPPPALSAPGLVGPISILNQPISGPRGNRRRRNRPYSHAHIEVDLVGPTKLPEGSSLLRRLETLLSAGSEVEAANLLRLTAATLHALASRGFRWIDHWEIQPGGWLPLPSGKGRPTKEEPVGEFLTSVENGARPTAATARSFSVRLSDRGGNRVDMVVRRIHRRHRHALTLDLWGRWTREMVDGVMGSLASRLPVSKSTLTKFQYA